MADDTVSVIDQAAAGSANTKPVDVKAVTRPDTSSLASGGVLNVEQQKVLPVGPSGEPSDDPTTLEDILRVLVDVRALLLMLVNDNMSAGELTLEDMHK